MARGKPKGRFVRNLQNGKKYTTKKQSTSGQLRSEKALARLDCSLMMKCTDANSGPKAIARRTASYKRFMKNNPGWMSARQKKMYRDNPELRIVRREWLTKYIDLLGLATTDPEIMDNLVFNCRFCVNGVEVLRYEDTEREKSAGVVTY